MTTQFGQPSDDDDDGDGGGDDDTDKQVQFQRAYTLLLHTIHSGI